MVRPNYRLSETAIFNGEPWWYALQMGYANTVAGGIVKQFAVTTPLFSTLRDKLRLLTEGIL